MHTKAIFFVAGRDHKLPVKQEGLKLTQTVSHICLIEG